MSGLKKIKDVVYKRTVCLLRYMINFKYPKVIQYIMSRITINVNDDLEKRFRIKVIEELGGKRGDITTALEEAMEMWIASKVDKTKNI